jgi:hypothetical protein
MRKDGDGQRQFATVMPARFLTFIVIIERKFPFAISS